MEAIAALVLGIIFALIVAGLGYIVMKMRTVVPTNMVHIVQSKTGATSYGRNNAVAGNIYYNWPSMIPRLGVTVIMLPESNFTIDLKGYAAYDEKRLPFLVDVAAFFRIEKSDLAAQRITSFDDLKTQLTQIVQGAVRRTLSQNTLEHIMEARATLGKQFTDEVEAQLAEWGVTTVKTIEFMDIRDAADSKVISNIMHKEQSRIDRESRVAIAENQQAAETREIEKARAIELSRQEKDQQVGIRTAEVTREVGIQQEKAQQAVAVAARETATATMAVQEVTAVRNAEITKQTSVIAAQQAAEVQIVNSDAAAKVQIVTAKAAADSTELQAQGELAATLKRAEGISAEGKATAEAEQAMLMAPVNAQITLAEKIGSDKEYQKYLIGIKQIETQGHVGMSMASAMGSAKMTIVANGSDIQTGATNLMDMFGPKGGMSLTGLMASLSGTPEGEALLGGITSRLAGNSASADKAA
jgi:flotillin